MFEKKQKETYNKEEKKPVIRISICTGEQVAGFKDLKTGKFQDIMLITNKKDEKEFRKRYGIQEAEIIREW